MDKIKDTFRVMLAMGDDLEKACVKATNRDAVVPKEKHVQRILHELDSGNFEVAQKIMDTLLKRYESHEWVVVLKTLMVFHRCILEGSSLFFDKVARFSSNIFSSCTNFVDPDAWALSEFIQSYARYLEEKCSVFSDVGFDIVNDGNNLSRREATLYSPNRSETLPSTRLKDAPVQKLTQLLPRIQDQLSCLLRIPFKASILSNEVAMGAFSLLMKESFRLFRAVNDGVLNMLEHFFDMDKLQARNSLRQYKEFTRLNEQVISLYDFARSLRNFAYTIPELKSAPTDVVASLEDHLASLESGEPSSAGKKSSSKEKMSSPPKQSLEEFLQKGDDSDDDIVIRERRASQKKPSAPFSTTSASDVDPFEWETVGDRSSSQTATNADPFSFSSATPAGADWKAQLFNDPSSTTSGPQKFPSSTNSTDPFGFGNMSIQSNPANIAPGNMMGYPGGLQAVPIGPSMGGMMPNMPSVGMMPINMGMIGMNQMPGLQPFPMGGMNQPTPVQMGGRKLQSGKSATAGMPSTGKKSTPFDDLF